MKTEELINKLFEVQEKMDTKLDGIVVVQVRQEEILKEHMRRTEIQEEKLEKFQEHTEGALEPIKRHIHYVEGSLKLLGILSLTVGIATGIFEMIKFFF